MNEVKFRYIVQHVESGNIEVKYYFLAQLEQRTLKELSPVFIADYVLLGRSQFIGLKDKNGKEICTGDIFENSFGRYKVEFDSDYGGFLPFTDDDGCGCCSSGMTGLDSESGAVIGNIFENPELMEGS